MAAVLAAGAWTAAQAAPPSLEEASSHALCSELAVVGHAVVASVAVTPALDEVTLRVRVTHRGRVGGAGASHVVARLTSRSPAVQVVDGEAAVPNLRAGSTVLSEDTVTVRKPRGVPLDPAHVAWTVSGARDAIVPEAWAGTWSVTTTFRDPDSGEARGTDIATGVIRPDEAFGLFPAAEITRCGIRTSADAMELACSFKVDALGCRVDGTGRLSLGLDGDTLSGRGSWSGTSSAGCPQAGPFAEGIEVTGTRLDHDVTSPFPTGASLLAKFISHVAVLPYLEVPQ